MKIELQRLKASGKRLFESLINHLSTVGRPALFAVVATEEAVDFYAVRIGVFRRKDTENRVEAFDAIDGLIEVIRRGNEGHV